VTGGDGSASGLDECLADSLWSRGIVRAAFVSHLTWAAEEERVFLVVADPSRAVDDGPKPIPGSRAPSRDDARPHSRRAGRRRQEDDSCGTARVEVFELLGIRLMARRLVKSPDASEGLDRPAGVDVDMSSLAVEKASAWGGADGSEVPVGALFRDYTRTSLLWAWDRIAVAESPRRSIASRKRPRSSLEELVADVIENDPSVGRQISSIQSQMVADTLQRITGIVSRLHGRVSSAECDIQSLDVITRLLSTPLECPVVAVASAGGEADPGPVFVEGLDHLSVSQALDELVDFGEFSEEGAAKRAEEVGVEIDADFDIDVATDIGEAFALEDAAVGRGIRGGVAGKRAPACFDADARSGKRVPV
jgi:hypothetical protein